MSDSLKTRLDRSNDCFKHPFYFFWPARAGPVARDSGASAPNLGGTLIYSDNGGTINWNVQEGDQPDGDDSFIMRLRHKAFRSRLESGVTILRKDWTDTSRDDWRSLQGLMYNNIFSADIAFTPRNLVSVRAKVGRMTGVVDGYDRPRPGRDQPRHVRRIEA